jgi:segregation and condensation protein B
MSSTPTDSETGEDVEAAVAAPGHAAQAEHEAGAPGDLGEVAADDESNVGAAQANVIAFRRRPEGGATVGPMRTSGGVGEASDEQEPALEHQLEALLFVSPTPLTTEALAEATDTDPDDLQDCLLDMMQQYSEGRCGIVLERVAGGWAFHASDRTRTQLLRLMRPQADTRVSPSSLETLAIVAYLQPISRPDVAKIRGVSVDAAMTGLMERGFVEEAGRSDTGAVLFRTTALFERAFGLSSIGALPELEGFTPSEDDVARLREQLESMAAARVE